MKYLLNIFFSICIFNISFAQFKKNGEPDMRFKVNRGFSSAPNYSSNSQYSYQRAYIRKSTGVFVDGSFHTTRNSTNTDNMSTKGNFNPFKGIFGRRAKDYSSEAYNYGSGRVIHRGIFGGRYYINDEGKRVYVPKR